MDGPPRKRTRSAATTSSDNDNALQTREDLLDASVYLTYDILRIIFQYLNITDLMNAAMVCRSWLEAANNERQMRGPFCFRNNYIDKNTMIQSLKNLRIKPHLGLYFVSNLDYFNQVMIGGLSHLNGINIQDSANIGIALHPAGIIMDKLEIQNTNTPHIVFAFLPESPAMTIQTFKVADFIKTQTGRNDNFNDDDEIIRKFKVMLNEINKKFASNDVSTCLMLFSNWNRNKWARRFAKALKCRDENVVTSLWGGTVYRLSTFNIKKKKGIIDEEDAVGVLISGLIRTWSIIVNINYDTEEQVEARLILWKAQIKLERHSIGFMFACQGRGEAMYNKANVESSIFKRLFPKIPLVGCFGDGEFGKNTISIPEVNVSEKSALRYSKNWYNTYSTVFMILTYD